MGIGIRGFHLEISEEDWQGRRVVCGLFLRCFGGLERTFWIWKECLGADVRKTWERAGR